MSAILVTSFLEEICISEYQRFGEARAVMRKEYDSWGDEEEKDWISDDSAMRWTQDEGAQVWRIYETELD